MGQFLFKEGDAKTDLVVVGGGHISETIKEAINYANTIGETVNFVFNEKIVKVYPTKDIVSVYHYLWHNKVFGLEKD